MSPVKRIFTLVIALFCLLSAAALVANAGLPERADYTGLLTADGIIAPELAAVAPPFTALRPDGPPLSLADMRGTPVIINFWATWCGPCASEMPHIQALYETYHDEIRVLGVNLGESREVVAQWAADYGLTFDLLLDSSGEIASLYQLRGQPSTYVVSPDGIITHIFYGPTTFTQLQAALPPTL